MIHRTQKPAHFTRRRQLQSVRANGTQANSYLVLRTYYDTHIRSPHTRTVRNHTRHEEDGEQDEEHRATLRTPQGSQTRQN